MEDFIIFTLTYNVAAGFPETTDDLRPILNLDISSTKGSKYVTVPDLYVICLQEVKSQPQNIVWDALFHDPWTARFKEALAQFGFVKINTLRMQGLVTSLFLKREHLVHLRDVETLWTRRGFGGIWGNKGAVSTRFVIHGCSICIVNCHLTPHDHLLTERIKDYLAILDGQTFSYNETSKIFFHDYVFWLGDLNFRLEEGKNSHEIVEMLSSKKNHEQLLKSDQLRSVKESGQAFSELEEMPITFPPTYKFETGHDSYDIKRRPAWTDRILYKANRHARGENSLTIAGSKYKSHMAFRCSDHRPVTALFTVQVMRPTIEKLVDFMDIDLWYTGESNKVFFKVVATLETSPEDWIGIFKADFNSVDEYVAYVYAMPNFYGEEDQQQVNPSNTDGTIDFSVTFPEDSVNFDGTFVLLYFSHTTKSIYGMSKEFNSVSRAEPVVARLTFNTRPPNEL